jgi:hypothetical protein
MRGREERLSRAEQTAIGVVVTVLILVPLLYLEWLRPLPLLAKIVVGGALGYTLNILASSAALTIRTKFRK